MTPSAPKGLLVLAFGGADSIEGVEPFIRNVLKGRPVPDAAIEAAKERYRLIGGSSPLLDITLGQASSIETILNGRGKGPGPYKAYVGMRHWRPYIKDAVRAMADDGVKEAASVVMSPFTSNAATGGYVKDVEEASASVKTPPEIRPVPDWHTHPLFLESVAEEMKLALADMPPAGDVLAILSLHSLPKASLADDPYEAKIRESAAELKKLMPMDMTIAYQSKGGGVGEWLGPGTEDAVLEAKRLGKKGVLIVPLGFVAEHVETLYDIDILFRRAAASAGLSFGRSRPLGAHPKFISMLARLVRARLSGGR
jgi:ferrochelatase